MAKHRLMIEAYKVWTYIGMSVYGMYYQNVWDPKGGVMQTYAFIEEKCPSLSTCLLYTSRCV